MISMSRHINVSTDQDRIKTAQYKTFQLADSGAERHCHFSMTVGQADILLSLTFSLRSLVTRVYVLLHRMQEQNAVFC